jgi:subtilase family serine protease
LRQVPGSKLAAVEQATAVGKPAATQVMHLSIAMKPRFANELASLADAVSDPASPLYRRFLTPKEIGERFGASQAEVNRVVAYLKGNGIRIERIPTNRMAILAEASVAQAERAFSTEIKTLDGFSPEGKALTFRANTRPVALPANIAGSVLCVAGLDNYARPTKMTTLNPGLARALYGTAPYFANGIGGQGCSIAISNWDGYDLYNAALFVDAAGLPVPPGGSLSNVHTVAVGSNNSGYYGQGEADLDIQMELSTAPLAEIYIYDGDPFSPDYLGLLTAEASDNVADIISESYGWSGITGAYATACHYQHLVMSSQGQTYICASGDTGTASLSQHGYPDCDPEVLTVGGTKASVNTSTGARISEVGWSGSGGGWVNTDVGLDNFNYLPSWQHGNGVPTNINRRLVPDVALQAYDPAGAFYIVYAAGLVEMNGTSCASPWFAAGLAVLEQRLDASGLGHRLGRVNDLIYSENGRTGVWYDITSGSNGTLPSGTSGSAHSGWDFVTGWGAPNFDAWYG